jgi:hypothetical protein
MKTCALRTVLGLAFIALGALIVTATPAFATSTLQVTLQAPDGTLTMGDTPKFSGAVTNLDLHPAKGLVVYLSLVSLQPGDEHPVDLEDWSAQKAVRIDRLNPGATNRQEWGMRLIQAGKFGVALTVVDPKKNRPIVSELVPFEIQPKATLVVGQVLPVAIGEPLLLVLLWGGIGFCSSRSFQKQRG